MADKKKPSEEESSKKTEIAVTEKKTSAKKPIVLAQPTESDLWQAFNDTFERFRDDFEDILFPPHLRSAFSILPETRVPVVDLENREKEFVLKAEMPGFKKEDIEIEVQEDSVTISGTAGWTYDKKGNLYICKERACKTFHREIDLPEQIKVDEVTANLSEGVLEITLPKKVIKHKRKVTLK